MAMLCWNCQGLGNPLTVRELWALVARERPTLVFLMETKQPDEVILRHRRKLHFLDSFTIAPLGTADLLFFGRREFM